MRNLYSFIAFIAAMLMLVVAAGVQNVGIPVVFVIILFATVREMKKEVA